MIVPGSMFRIHSAGSIDYSTYCGRAQWLRLLSPRLFRRFFALIYACLGQLGDLFLSVAFNMMFHFGLSIETIEIHPQNALICAAILTGDV